MDNNKPGFKRPPLTEAQKKKIEDKILAGAPDSEDEPTTKNKPITIRIPEQYHRDIEKLQRKSGLTKNSLCIEIFRIGMKALRKEIDER